MTDNRRGVVPVDSQDRDLSALTRALRYYGVTTADLPNPRVGDMWIVNGEMDLKVELADGTYKLALTPV